MNDRIARTSEGTIAWVAGGTPEAERQAAQLRAAGFADVRLSERSGTTAEAHVPADEGLTASDFAAALETAGFGRDDARVLTEAVERGGVLVTLAAGEHADTALAVLRGERVQGRAVGPVDVPVAATAGVRSVVTPDVITPGVVAPGVVTPGVVTPAAVTPAGSSPAADTRTAGFDDAAFAGDDPTREIAGVIPLREERLDVSTTRETGEARVRKEVVTEHRTITVPVRREELVIERDGEADVRVPLAGDGGPA